MDPRLRRFWFNWFLGGFGIALGAFGIGLMICAAWLFFWPVNIKIIMATGGLLVTLSVIMMGKSGKYITEMYQPREQPTEDTRDGDSPA